MAGCLCRTCFVRIAVIAYSFALPLIDSDLVLREAYI